MVLGGISLAGGAWCLALTASVSVPWEVACAFSLSLCCSICLQSPWDGEEERFVGGIRGSRRGTLAFLHAASLCAPHASDTDLALGL